MDVLGWTLPPKSEIIAPAVTGTRPGARSLAALAALLLVGGCASTPEAAPSAPPPVASPESPEEAARRAAVVEAARRTEARARREQQLLDLVASANLIAMPEVARARVRTTSMGEVAQLRFEAGDVRGAREAVGLALESAEYAQDARLIAPLRHLRFLILHYAALDAAKKGDSTYALELFDTIAGLPGLTAAQRAQAGGDRLLVMESLGQGASAAREEMFKGALARMLGLDEAPAPTTSAPLATRDPFADSEAMRVALTRDIGKEVAEAQLPSAGGDVIASTGTFDPTTVVQVVSANKGSITACYTQALRGGGGERGKLELLVQVAPTGDVASSRVVTAQFKTSPLGRCIADTVARWKFPPFDGEPRSVELPFVLDYLQ